MPSYYNPYNFVPASYTNPYMPQMPQPMSQTPAYIDADLAMKWVEGEIGAKAFQMPQGWPFNRPIPLWDSTDTVIWLKSWNQIGVPNPMQKLEYKLPANQTPMLPNVSEQAKPEEAGPDMSQFVTKDDLNQLKEEIQRLVRNTSGNHQNGSISNQQNRGGAK